MEECKRGKVKICKKQNQINPYGNYTKEFFQEDENFQDMTQYIYEDMGYKNEVYKEKFEDMYIMENVYQANNNSNNNCNMNNNQPSYENSQLVPGCETNNTTSCGCCNNTTQNNNCNCGCSNTNNSECKLASEESSSCVQNACQERNSCCIPIQAGNITSNNTLAYPAQINRISDSISFKQYSNYSVPTIDDWTVSVSCGTLPSTGTEYIFNVKEICIGDNELTIASQTINVNSRDITDSGTTVFTGPSSSMINYGIENYNSCCCEKGLGTPLLYSRTNLSYQLAAAGTTTTTTPSPAEPDDSDTDDNAAEETNTLAITLKGNCGCVQIIATATITVPITFTFSNVSGQICAPSNTIASYIQQISKLQLGFACIEGATISETAGDDGAAPTYTVTVPSIEMILCLYEVLNLVNVEEIAVLGLSQPIVPKKMPIAPQICNFVNCSVKR